MKISEIARLAGVSSAAVSRYFNDGSISEEKRQRIKKIIDQTGYKPNLAARSLRKQRNDNIGIIVPKVNSDSVSNLIEGVSSVLNKAGFMTIFSNAENDEKRELDYLNLMEESELAGVILMGTVLTPKHISFFKKSKIPIIVCGQNHPSVSCIYHDDRNAAREITRFMISKGRRKLAYVGAVESDLCVGLNRRIGVEEAMMDSGIDPSKLIKTQVRFSVEDGYRGMSEILDGVFVPDGVICATDTLAIGAMKALVERGYIIPRDTAIGAIGGGNAGTIVTPKLTTVKLYHKESGEKAAQQLLSMIDYIRQNPGKKPPVSHTMLGFNLIERESI